MAVNTAERRFSMLNFGDGGHFHLTFETDGSVDADDRQHLLDCYSGIAFDVPAVEVAVPRRRAGGTTVKQGRRSRRVKVLSKEEFLLPFEAALLEIEKQEAEEQNRAAVLTRERAKQIARSMVGPKKIGRVDPKQKLIILEEEDKIILELLDDDLFL